MPTPRENLPLSTLLLKCQLNYYSYYFTLFVTLLKVIEDLYTSTPRKKKVNIFLQTPPLSFGLSPGVKMAENVLLCLTPQ